MGFQNPVNRRTREGGRETEEGKERETHTVTKRPSQITNESTFTRTKIANVTTMGALST